MIFCTEDSVCRTMIIKEHPKTIVHLSVVQQQNSSYFPINWWQVSLKLEQFVARQYWLRRCASPHRFRANRV